MKVALFGDQVESFNEAIVYNGQYIISNAPIRLIEERWRNNSDKLPFQMTFGGQTVVQKANCETIVAGPMFQSIQSIPRILIAGAKHDVLGIVLYAEDKARIINANQGREFHVREIIVTNQTMDQPLVITAWNDLADIACDAISVYAKTFDVIGFTALRPSVHKRVTFKFDATDYSGTMAFITFTADTEKLFGISAEEIYLIKNSHAITGSPSQDHVAAIINAKTEYEATDGESANNSVMELSRQPLKISRTKAHIAKTKSATKDWNPIVPGNFAQTETTMHIHLALDVNKIPALSSDKPIAAVNEQGHGSFGVVKTHGASIKQEASFSKSTEVILTKELCKKRSLNALVAVTEEIDPEQRGNSEIKYQNVIAEAVSSSTLQEDSAHTTG
uniref:Replication protein A OB domain-containing protein n=1 Tax=Chenopodium quinoa TaxID=63459 RepID=A0A803N6K2_CHEQI